MERTRSVHARPWSELMVNYKRIYKMTGVLVLSVFFCAQAYPQRQSQGSSAQTPGQGTDERMPLHSPDIIADNLDKAAASGQILEEADLTDRAIEQRLRSDLRARVLATRLLQRYGYLVPQLNPDSEAEAEQKLVRQERAQILARAAERGDTLGGTANPSREAACDPRNVPECALPSSVPVYRESLPAGPATPAGTPRSQTPVERAEEASPNQPTRPDGTPLTDGQRGEYPAGASSLEPLLASTRAESNPNLGGVPQASGYGNRDTLPVPQTSTRDYQSLATSQPNPMPANGTSPRSDRSFDRYPIGRNPATS